MHDSEKLKTDMRDDVKDLMKKMDEEYLLKTQGRRQRNDTEDIRVNTLNYIINAATAELEILKNNK